MTKIVLATLNAKYIHASLGLRYLLANMARYGGEDLRTQSVLREFTIGKATEEIAQALLSELGEADSADGADGAEVQIIGLGVYIWNVSATTEVVRHLKRLRPSVVVILGGPEV
nr:B12-binding domain-containing radical SAM protein [Rhodocyclaceae bacterium]